MYHKIVSLCYIVLLLVLINPLAKGQTDDFDKQRSELVLFNVGFNGLVGGFGSLINHKGEQADFNTFLRGFYKGAIGGYISHVGLSMTHQIDKRQKLELAWPARIVNAFGSSIIQNAAEDKRMLENLSFNLYFTRLEYNGAEKKFKARFFVSSLYGFLLVGNGARFDLGKSLKTGIFYFESDNRFRIAGNSGRATGQVSTIGMGSSLVGDQFYDTYAEEVAHILQYDRKVGGNALAVKFDARKKEKSRTYKSLSKYVYFDLNGPIFWLSYFFQANTGCNFFEQEARNYSNKRFEACERD